MCPYLFKSLKSPQQALSGPKVQVVQRVIAHSIIIYVIFLNFQQSKTKKSHPKKFGLMAFQRKYYIFISICSYQPIIDISEK